jgi:xanthine dehydrogenase accessory factor
MHWLTAVAELRRTRRPGVLVTVVGVRGHAPREAGAKMVVGEHRCWGTVGGGNLERAAVERSRALLRSGASAPETEVTRLSERAPARYGVQCCGGEVTLLYEPLRPVPAVAVFGVGHVGTELARVLARHDVELHLVDSRAGQVDAEALAPVTSDAVARVHRHHAPVPELVLGELPAGSHVLIMTHDHAEDAALCDAALRCGHLGTIGLIGSSAKWSRFAARLAAEGHDAEALARITTPIGLPDITGKHPATIAVSVAADLLRRLEGEAAAAGPGAGGAAAVPGGASEGSGAGGGPHRVGVGDAGADRRAAS